jgi:hypothetical protein
MVGLLAGTDASRAIDPMEMDIFPGLDKPPCDKLPTREIPVERPVIKAVVANWPGCAPYRNSLPLTKLCKIPNSEVDWNTREYLDRRLRAHPTYLASLCEIDAAIVQAQHDCELGTRHQNERRLANLVISLADNWKQHGVYERADQLYAQAFALAAVEVFTSVITYILERWADLKVRMGDAETARELARRHTEIERRKYDNGESIDAVSCSPTTAGLTYALRAEANILERQGFDTEARALRQEIEELLPKPQPCESVCGG